MHWVGIVNRHGYVSQQKSTICDAREPCPLIWSTPKLVLAEFDWFLVLTSRLDAYISKYDDFCAHDDNDDNDNDNDTTDYFTPYACARGNYYRNDHYNKINVHDIL